MHFCGLTSAEASAKWSKFSRGQQDDKGWNRGWGTEICLAWYKDSFGGTSQPPWCLQGKNKEEENQALQRDDRQQK